MRYRGTDRFWSDYRRLKSHEQERFKRAVREINAAYAARGASSLPRWPAHLRIAPLARDGSIMEMTWSFTAPDGRATFSFETRDDEIILVWRRIGDHSIFNDP